MPFLNNYKSKLIMKDPILKISNVSRDFGAIQALKKVDFEINEGEIMGLVGENGAGKSTLVKIISGFDNGFNGDYYLHNINVHFDNNQLIHSIHQTIQIYAYQLISHL